MNAVALMGLGTVLLCFAKGPLFGPGEDLASSCRVLPEVLRSSQILRVSWYLISYKQYDFRLSETDQGHELRNRRLPEERVPQVFGAAWLFLAFTKNLSFGSIEPLEYPTKFSLSLKELQCLSNLIFFECVFKHVLVAKSVYFASFHGVSCWDSETFRNSHATDRKNGIISQLTRVLVGLYEEPERPANAWAPSRGKLRGIGSPVTMEGFCKATAN